MPALKRILAVEDDDRKWERVEKVVLEALAHTPEIVRARDQFEAERLVDEGGWDLLLLDISLDIRAAGVRGGRGTHDYTGGVKIAGRMFYYRREVPTIIITGFDNFPTARATQEQDVILGLTDVVRRVRRYLPDHLVGTVRYGPAGWEGRLAELLREREA